MAMLLLYTFSCELNISANCQSVVMDNHFLPKKSVVFLREGLKLNDSPPTHSDIIPPGGTYYRNTPINRTEVEQYVSGLVQDIQVKNTIEQKEKRRLVEENRLRLERQMDANLEEIELENWNLDNYYHMPRTPKISIPKPILEQRPQNVRTTSTLRVPGFVQKLTKIVPPEKIVYKQPQPMGDMPMVNKELENSYDELLGMESLEATGPDSSDDGVESKHELEIKEPVLMQQVDPKPKRKVLVNVDGGLSEIMREENPLVEKAKKKKKSIKAKKKKKKQKKSILNLPNSFPYFDNGYPPPKIGTYTCR